MIFKKLNKSMCLVSSFLIITFCFLFVFSFSACGRRGDPMPIVPYIEPIVQEDTDLKKDQERSPIKEETVDQKSGVLMPDAPVGLMGFYTQKVVVLTWDEVRGQNVKRYKVYRSSGAGYMFVGDTVAPAFTDREVKPDRKYYYRFTAVGVLESRPSKEIVIITEVR